MDNNKEILIFLNNLNGFGPKTITKIMDNLKNLEKLWYFNKNNLKSLGLSNYKIKNFFDKKDDFKKGQLLAKLKKEKINFITLYDQKYPKKLKNIYDPPPVLFYRGDLNFQIPAVAIIGSRNSTVYGRKIASKTASELAKMGLNVISGFAKGIDSTAHQGAVMVESGITTAVLGNGLNYLYPSNNKLLSEKILKNGLMLTEFNPETAPKAQNFPRRNRIISALSDLLLVVEAGKKSGTLITVDYALEQGKEIMAVPANIDRPNSIGVNRLIKKGAAVFTGVDDIFGYLKEYLQADTDNNDFVEKNINFKNIYPNLNSEEIMVLNLFQHEIEIYYDDLLRLSNLNTDKIDRILIKLELMDLIIRLKAKKYQFKGLQNLLKPI